MSPFVQPTSRVELLPETIQGNTGHMPCATIVSTFLTHIVLQNPMVYKYFLVYYPYTSSGSHRIGFKIDTNRSTAQKLPVKNLAHMELFCSFVLQLTL